MNHIPAFIRQTAIFLDRWHWVLLTLAAPLLLFPAPSRVLALLVVPALWVIAWLAGREPLPRTPLNAALLLMFGMVLVSLWATYDIAVSLPAISGSVLGLGIYYAFVRVGQQTRGWWMGLTFFLIGVIGLAVVGLFGIRWVAKIGFLSPIISLIPPLLVGLPGVDEGLHPNEVAGGLLWGIGLCWYLTLAFTRNWNAAFGRGWKSILTVIAWMASIFVTGVFVLTQSRGGSIAFALTGLALIALILWTRSRKLLLIGLIILTFIVALATTQGELIAIVREAMDSEQNADPAFSLDSLEARQEIWSRAIYGIQDFPLTGMGMNTFPHIAPVLYPLFVISPDYPIGHAHNEFAQAALDLGIPGLIAFMALYLGAFWMLRQVWQNHSSQSLSSIGMVHHRWLALGLGSGLLAHLLYSLTDAIPLGSKYGILFWMLLGLITGLYQQTRSKTD